MVSQMINASYFDGQSARLHPVELQPGAGALMVMGGALAKEYAYADVTLAEPFAQAPSVLYFADGARCEVADAAAGHALAAALGYRKSKVVLWQDHWYAAIAALVLLIALGAAIAIWGLPAAAEKIAASIPPSMDQKLGDSAQRALDMKVMQPTRLSDQRVAQVQAVLRSIAPAHTRMPVHLRVRNSPGLGANALALPNGTIIVTDAMILLILDKRDDFGADGEAALAGVLAHEIGHIEHRHSVRVLARSSLTAAASAALFGDFSTVAAGVPTVVMNAHYSRQMESDADSYALALLSQKGMPSAPLADVLDALERIGETDPSRNLPSWMRVTLSYVASHPASAERSARLRATALP